MTWAMLPPEEQGYAGLYGENRRVFLVEYARAMRRCSHLPLCRLAAAVALLMRGGCLETDEPPARAAPALVSAEQEDAEAVRELAALQLRRPGGVPGE